MFKLFIKQTGTTLIELLLYMGILSIFLSVLAGIFSNIIGVQLETQSVSSVEQDSQFVLARLTNDIHRAESIAIPAALGAQTQTLQLVIDGTNYTYQITDNNLTLTNNLGTNTINSVDTHITHIEFTRIGNVNGNNTVLINLTIESATAKTTGERESKDIQTAIGIR